MEIGALEGQTRGDYFLDSIFDPSVNQCSDQSKKSPCSRIGKDMRGEGKMRVGADLVCLGLHLLPLPLGEGQLVAVHRQLPPEPDTHAWVTV